MLEACMFFGQKRDCVALTEYETLMYEGMCNTVTNFCKLQTKRLQEELGENEIPDGVENET